MNKIKLLASSIMISFIAINSVIAWTLTMETLSGWQKQCRVDDQIVSCAQFFWDDKVRDEMEDVRANEWISTCTLNGKEVPCEQVVNSVKWFAKIFIIWWLLCLLLTAFWIWMLVDAIKHQDKDKTIWILIIIFTWWLGAIVYFFVARKHRLQAAKQ